MNNNQFAKLIKAIEENEDKFTDLQLNKIIETINKLRTN